MKRFDGTFCWAQTSYFWRVMYFFFLPDSNSKHMTLKFLVSNHGSNYYEKGWHSFVLTRLPYILHSKCHTTYLVRMTWAQNWQKDFFSKKKSFANLLIIGHTEKKTNASSTHYFEYIGMTCYNSKKNIQFLNYFK